MSALLQAGSLSSCLCHTLRSSQIYQILLSKRDQIDEVDMLIFGKTVFVRVVWKLEPFYMKQKTKQASTSRMKLGREMDTTDERIPRLWHKCQILVSQSRDHRCLSVLQISECDLSARLTVLQYWLQINDIEFQQICVEKWLWNLKERFNHKDLKLEGSSFTIPELKLWQHHSFAPLQGQRGHLGSDLCSQSPA